MDKKLIKLSPLTESTFYILLVLKNPLHGYGIIKEIESLTNGRLLLAAGTLYGVIQKLLKYKLIYLVNEDVNNKGKKEYCITDMGNKVLTYEIKRIKLMIKNSKMVVN